MVPYGLPGYNELKITTVLDMNHISKSVQKM